MSDIADSLPASGPSTSLVRMAPILFGVTVFTSAALVFLVEPMVAKLVLPTLGGSPAVWNTCMAFFQVALLVGYGYAHLLQRVRSLKIQTAVHAVVLIAAALVLPLHIQGLRGDGATLHPIGWLLGVLALSIGAPFAALSATAPLAQAWYARVRTGHADATNPYVLYVASNLGSLIALLAYPIVVEPTLRLSSQTLSWSIGYSAFVVLMLLVALIATRTGTKAESEAEAVASDTSRAEAPPVTWRERLIWIGLAAAPSSLMLGVTTHITTDIASAPFLWVAPLALYLLTFIIAFSSRPALPKVYVLIVQGATMAAAVALLGALSLPAKFLLIQLGIHLVNFFLTALVCHQTLAERRPHPSRLTEFYLLMSLGGVIGGSFNAFIAPVIFSGVWEYPLVLVLAVLARPWGKGRLSMSETVLTSIGIVSAILAVATGLLFGYGVIKMPHDPGSAEIVNAVPKFALAFVVVSAFLVRDRALAYFTLILAVTLAAHNMAPRENVLGQSRSFFGVLKITTTTVTGYGKPLRLLAHGTTLHGAQALEDANPCRPMTYYGPGTPIGQVLLSTGTRKRHMAVGAIGMGAGTVAAYARPDDEYRFYEIDPQVIAISTNPKNFSYIGGCAKASHISWVLGDARLTVAKEKPGAFDVLLVDAFSSDAVPAHLLTVEAMKLYLQRVTEDGVVIMHLSNRHLDLERPVAAVAKAAGGVSLRQNYRKCGPAYGGTVAVDALGVRCGPNGLPDYFESAEDVIIVAKNAAALAPFRADPSWHEAQIDGVRPWTDDYTNLVSALARKIKDR
ncbi:fused MFS/spermidine synthase [soil metagenome]